MKKRIAFLAVAVVAGCSATFAGCSSKSVANVIALSSNWYSITNFKGIQPTFVEGNEDSCKETLTYAVTFEAPSAANSTYSVSYNEGTYTTEFYAKTFDSATLTHADFRSAYTEAGSLTVYYYKTVLSIDGVYTFAADGSTKQFGDSITTECYFLPCSNYLRPLYSSLSVKSTTPANYQAGSMDSAYLSIDCDYVNYYSYDGNEVITLKKDNADGATTTEKRGLSASNPLFDTASLNIAIRAMSNLSDSLSQGISLYSPENGVQDFTLSGSSTALGEQESKDITSLLQEKSLFTATEEQTTVPTVAVNVTYGGSLSGVSQTYWYAAIDNKLNNTGRATLLKISTPLSYNLGTLNYVLKEVNGTLWQG